MQIYVDIFEYFTMIKSCGIKLIQGCLSSLILLKFQAGKPQPDAATALAVGTSEGGDLEWSDKYSHGPQVC